MVIYAVKSLLENPVQEVIYSDGSCRRKSITVPGIELTRGVFLEYPNQIKSNQNVEYHSSGN
jgi:hypothetical protein